MVTVTKKEKHLLVALLDLVNYAHLIGDTLENDFIEFSHTGQLDDAVSIVFDSLGVPADDYDDDTGAGYSRDWINNQWFEWEFSNEQFIDFVIDEVNKSKLLN